VGWERRSHTCFSALHPWIRLIVLKRPSLQSRKESMPIYNIRSQVCHVFKYHFIGDPVGYLTFCSTSLSHIMTIFKGLYGIFLQTIKCMIFLKREIYPDHWFSNFHDLCPPSKDFQHLWPSAQPNGEHNVQCCWPYKNF